MNRPYRSSSGTFRTLPLFPGARSGVLHLLPGNPGFFQNRKTGFWLPVNPVFLTLLLTLCGLTSQKTHRGGLGLGGSVHEEARPCFPYLVQPSFKGIDAGYDVYLCQLYLT